ncbi:DsbA family protein [Streptomyces sp. NPDC026673]|uniref:DsbA family oxidoreductase n=1 Tax=Streptomyces sp. NPDC026673 TaxID=3155724 RepID=UPI003404D3DC
MPLAPAPETGRPSRGVTAEHWFDFICPYCYVARDRNRILRGHGIRVVEHALQIHPEIGPGGIPAGPRRGPAYAFVAEEAAAAGLPLRWTDRIASSRPALAAFEWLAANGPRTTSVRFAEAVFAANFAEGRDIESEDLLLSLAEDAGGDAEGLHRVWNPGSMTEALARSRSLASRYGVHGTPTWVSGRHGISGLRPRQWFHDWATALTPPIATAAE